MEAELNSLQPDSQFRIDQSIQNLERRFLDQITPRPSPVWGQLENVPFIRILGQARFWEKSSPDSPLLQGYEQCMEDLITGAHGQRLVLLYFLVGSATRIHVYVGLNSTDAEPLLRTVLHSTLPGIQIAPQAEFHLGRGIESLRTLDNLGRLTGIPTRKSGMIRGTAAAAQGAEMMTPTVGDTNQIERLLRGLYGETWGYLVRAEPEDHQSTVQTASQRESEASIASAYLQCQVNLQQQLTPTDTQALSYEQQNRRARRLTELLEQEMARIERGRAQGMWQVEVYAFSSEETVLVKALALMRAIFSGPASTPDPIRTFRCLPSGTRVPDDMLVTHLNSFELATLCQLPREEFPGYCLTPYARFDVSLPPSPQTAAGTIRIGQVLDGTKDTGNPYLLDRRDLSKHALIVGVTGSGKTNTCFQILDQVWQRGKRGGVPFLVIEPAKTEYRDLLGARDGEKKLCFPGLQIFTLGDERIAPFRLNPFEFEVIDEEHYVHVQTHIDHLKSVFDAAFVMYAPMPYVLERCLHEVYQDAGWDLATGRNRQVATMLHLPPEVFPTLTDLYHKIGQVVDGLGYEERLRMDIRAALETRINSLRTGGKGLMLNTGHSIPMVDLLTRPTILELESIGDDDEKVFIIGLLLARLYEHRVVESKRHRTSAHEPPDFQHLTLIEEAHRLLRQVPTTVDTEIANVRGKAVETFANMLSEVRAYGESIVVSEQIPTKLVSDVTKSTNLKVVHRVVAADDRELLAGTMNLDDRQKRFIATLEVGHAAVYAEGDDAPFLIRIDEHDGTKVKGQIGDQAIRRVMLAYCAGPLYAPYASCLQFCHALRANEDRCPLHVQERGLLIAEDAQVRVALNAYILTTIVHGRHFGPSYSHLRDAMKTCLPGAEASADILVCALIHSFNQFFANKVRQYSWPLSVAQHLRTQFLDHLIPRIAQTETQPEEGEDIANLPAACVEYRRLCSREIGPYAGCEFCADKCLYRYEVAPVAEQYELRHELQTAIDAAVGDEEMWAQVRVVCWYAASKLLPSQASAARQGAALCFAVQAGALLEFTLRGQRKLGRNVAQTLQRETGHDT